jgi:hypothetical protein
VNLKKLFLVWGTLSCLFFLQSAKSEASGNIIKVEAENYTSLQGNVTVRGDGEPIATGYNNEKIKSVILSGASSGKFLDFSSPKEDYTSNDAWKGTLSVSDNATWKIDIPKAGFYKVTFTYNNPGTRWNSKRNVRDERNCRVLLNGDKSNLASDAGWVGWMIFSVSGYADGVTNGAVQNETSVGGNTKWNKNYMNVYIPAGKQDLTLAIEAPPGQGVYDGPNLDYIELEYIGDQYISEKNIPTIAKKFNHPGLYYTMQTLETMKKNKDQAGSVWEKGYKQLLESELSSASYTRPNDTKNYDSVTGTMFWKIVERGPYNNPDNGSSPFSKDGLAAHYNALRWYLTGDVNNAKKTIELLNGWASTLEDVKNNDARLIVAISAPAYINAAELMKHVYNSDPRISEKDKWSKKDMEQFDSFVRKLHNLLAVYYPQANGNWDALITVANMSMAVYLDDKNMFNEALRQFSRGDVVPGKLSMGALPNYVYTTGESQESNRDQIHASMGLEGLSLSSKIAYNQGLDLFKMYDHRLLKGAIYSLKYNFLKESVPSETFISDKARGAVKKPVFDILANYYRKNGSAITSVDFKLLTDGATALREGAVDEVKNPCGFINAMLFTDEAGQGGLGK